MPQSVPNLVWELNHARRKLELLVRQWLEKLGVVQPESARTISPMKPQDLEVDYPAAPPSPQPSPDTSSSNEERRMQPTHRRSKSANLADQYTRMYSNANKSGQDLLVRYATPALRESYDESGGLLAEDGGDTQTIPTGLVARYVARFQETAPATSPPEWSGDRSRESVRDSSMRRRSMLTNVEVIDDRNSQWADISGRLVLSDGNTLYLVPNWLVFLKQIAYGVWYPTLNIDERVATQFHNQLMLAEAPEENAAEGLEGLFTKIRSLLEPAKMEERPADHVNCWHTES